MSIAATLLTFFLQIKKKILFQKKMPNKGENRAPSNSSGENENDGTNEGYSIFIK